MRESNLINSVRGEEREFLVRTLYPVACKWPFQELRTWARGFLRAEWLHQQDLFVLANPSLAHLIGSHKYLARVSLSTSPPDEGFPDTQRHSSLRLHQKSISRHLSPNLPPRNHGLAHRAFRHLNIQCIYLLIKNRCVAIGSLSKFYALRPAHINNGHPLASPLHRRDGKGMQPRVGVEQCFRSEDNLEPSRSR